MISSEARGAWDTLAGTLRPYLARRAPPHVDVDDVLQDTLLRLHQSASALRDEDAFGAFVYRIARSTMIDHVRRAKPTRPLEDAGELEVEEVLSYDDSTEALVASFVAPFVAMLPSPYREALTLTEIEGLPQREAAELVGVSLAAMKSRVQRGRAELRRLLEACCALEIDARGGLVGCTPRPPEEARRRLQAAGARADTECQSCEPPAVVRAR